MENNSNTNNVFIEETRKRFKKAISHLKGEQIINTNQDVVNKMEINKSSMSLALKGDERYLTEKFITKFANIYGFNKNWLWKGEGSMFANADLPPINARFIEVYEYLQHTRPDFTPEKIGLSQEEINNIRIGNAKVPFIKIVNLKSLYPEINTDYITSNYGEILIPVIDYSKITDRLPQGELKEKEYPEKLAVKLVTTKAQAGWTEGYYNDEYLEDMPTILIDSEEKHHGNYLAFEVAGDSMEPDYIEGDVVICREVQRHLWQYKLHIKDWDFVIAHATNGIMLKEIIKHDVKNGVIYCHSLNPKYEDFKISLHEVRFLYNVIEVRQKGRSKRSNRAKDFL
ncbi:peptidase S24-like protein [Capnocytophaga sp. oral taxon 324 str. F0483]|nr:peptidase S24-like protein [Capnocytophaga sp. oral taxon 324 str. F0483]